jgi:hypothetical protein
MTSITELITRKEDDEAQVEEKIISRKPSNIMQNFLSMNAWGKGINKFKND